MDRTAIVFQTFSFRLIFLLKLFAAGDCRNIAQGDRRKNFYYSPVSALIDFISGSYSPLVHLLVDAAEQRLRDWRIEDVGGCFDANHQPGLSAGFFQICRLVTSATLAGPVRQARARRAVSRDIASCLIRTHWTKWGAD